MPGPDQRARTLHQTKRLNKELHKAIAARARGVGSLAASYPKTIMKHDWIREPEHPVTGRINLWRHPSAHLSDDTRAQRATLGALLQNGQVGNPDWMTWQDCAVQVGLYALSFKITAASAPKRAAGNSGPKFGEETPRKGSGRVYQSPCRHVMLGDLPLHVSL